MTMLMLYVGIAVTFLTVWGVVMVGSYLLQGADADEPTPATAATNWVTDGTRAADSGLVP